MKRILFLTVFFTSIISCFTASAQMKSLDFLDHRPIHLTDSTAEGISSYNIGSDKDLYLRLNVGKSLVEELAILAPKVSADSSLKTGNFQFCFLIDGKMVYQENLHPGAILLQDKIVSKPLAVVLISASRSGLWSINMWDRFMINSGIDLFGPLPKKLTVQVRVYIDAGKRIYSPVLLESSINMTRILPEIDEALLKPQAIKAGSGWPLYVGTYDEKLITALNTKIIQQSFKKINSVVVVKKGKLLLEEYFNASSRANLHDPRSVSKSFTGTLLGMAIHDGYLKSEEQKLGAFYNLAHFEHPSAKKENVRLVDLLTMSSAFDGNDEVMESPGNEENMYPTSNYVKFALDLPMEADKQNGKQWSYFTAGTMLLGDIMDKTIPGGLELYAKKKLFDPLGIDSLEWARTPQGKPFTGGGLRLRALDFAKFGQLYLKKGIWKDQQLVPKSWVDKSFRHLQILPSDRPGFYGFLFWNKTFKINGKILEAWYSSGNGGNKIYIFKEIDLVVVINASAYGTSFAHQQADQILEKYILPAVLK
ncbi:serine hydrolase domain-containing protein [Pedobacter kyonggii]|uniref:Class C beta-lactamase-related serine hydrolase n=1 Tax=Pedobacter kyonggii TaxID=1926871 RepID=A0A4Q9H926_9SPHI|nr:serine hydrolase [Pedobacter kyonggii]TBO40432.1 class C beta-lactamase-related serine hydrolase [Pedobacter kyonggii]